MNRSGDQGALITNRSRFTTLALTSLVSTILLVMAGSFVRVTGYGLGCPDWPLCYGRAVPPIELGAWVEFGHRLIGGVVGMQIAGLTWLAYKNHKDEKWIWRPAIITSVLLLIQVVLGGLHVLNELPRWTGLVHTSVATAIVGFLALLVAVSQPKLIAISGRFDRSFDLKKMQRWTLLCAGSVYLLILSGSLVTRTGASLACPSFPLCGISEVPDSLRNLVTIQMVHRIIALIVLIVVSYLLFNMLRNGHGERELNNLSYVLIVLLLVQVGLGISNVLLGLPLWSRILHLGAATSIWTVLVILAILFQQPQMVTQVGESTPVTPTHGHEASS
ncbi:MAG: heme A synthase [Candidatus Promineifilaceae bacterium]